MTGLIRRHYFSWSAIPAFYLDRAMRLLPAVLSLVGIGALLVFVSGIQMVFSSAPRLPRLVLPT